MTDPNDALDFQEFSHLNINPKGLTPMRPWEGNSIWVFNTGGSAVRQNCRNLNGEGASAGMMRGLGKEPRFRNRDLYSESSYASAALFPLAPQRPPNNRKTSSQSSESGKMLFCED